jgi:hypothetical protein
MLGLLDGLARIARVLRGFRFRTEELGFRFAHERIGFALQGGKVFLDHIPDDVVVDIVILVGKAIPQSDGRAIVADPGNRFGISAFEPEECLANDA